MNSTTFGLGILLLARCGTSATEAPAEAGAPSGAASVGAPCVPSQESSASFASAGETDVNIGKADPQCGGNICLANHFRGRVGCPYGQAADGQPPAGGKACTVPGASTPVAGKVAAQCTDRRASTTVICSCRCANANGKTDDGASYCACPSGLQCVQLATSLGPGDTISGAYCILAGTTFDKTTSCTSSCDPTTAPCP